MKAIKEINPIKDDTNVAVLSFGICSAIMMPDKSNKPNAIANMTA